MGELSAPALLLLAVVGAEDGAVPWDACRDRLATSPAELRAAVRELTERHLVVSGDPMAMRPPLRITPAGRALLDRTRRGEPRSHLRLTLAPNSDRGQDSLLVTLAEDDADLVRTQVDVSSYLLAALRYLLVLEPGSLSANTASAAARRIGGALLYPCGGCFKNPGRACGRCVRGVVRARMRDAASAGGWVRLDLHVEPPWTYVPWEMAALREDEYVVQDDRLALVRRLSRRARTGSLTGPLPVLVVWAKQPKDEDHATLLAEYGRLAGSSPGGDAASAVRFVDYETFDDADGLADAVARHRPRGVHVLGHGTDTGLATARAAVSRAAAAAALARDGVELVVLSSCFAATTFGTDQRGQSLAAAIAERGVESVVAFEGKVEAAHAARFAEAFYPTLGTVGSVEEAVRAGRRALLTGSVYYQYGQVVLFGR